MNDFLHESPNKFMFVFPLARAWMKLRTPFASSAGMKGRAGKFMDERESKGAKQKGN